MYPRFGDQTWLTPYGAALIAALGACWWYARRRAAGRDIDPSHVDMALPLVFLLSAAGARLVALVLPGDTWAAGAALPVHSRFRAFTLLGFAAPMLALYARLAQLRARELLDVFALPCVCWLGGVRVGCFLAGCCWGDLAEEGGRLAVSIDPGAARQILTLPWLAGTHWLPAVQFPAGSYAYQQHLVLGLLGAGSSASLPVHPTQLYELAALALLWAILRAYERSAPPPGALAAAMLLGYCVVRLLLDFLRADSALVLAGLTSTQLVSLGLAPLLAGWLWRLTAGAQPVRD